MKPQILTIPKIASIFILFLVFFWSLQGAVYSATGINKQINFQGKVVNTDGTNVSTASYNFLFCIYTTASPATPCTSGANNDAIWRESKSITVTDGIFRTALGDTTSLPGSVDFNTDNIYLGINFNSDGQMSPLVRFSAVAYAFNAQKVAGLTVTDTTGTFTLTAGKTLSVANTLSFAGTDSTTITFQGTDTYVGRTTEDVLTNKSIGSTGLTFSGATTDVTTGTNEALTIAPNGSGDVIIDTDSDSTLTLNGGGDGVDSLILTDGDILLSDGDFDISGGDFNVVLDAGDGSLIDGDSTDKTVDALTVDVGTLTDGVDGIVSDLNVTGNTGNDADSFASIRVIASNNATDQTTDDNIYGIAIADLGGTALAGNEYGIYQAGTGWDFGLYVEDAAHFNSTVAVTSTLDANGQVDLGDGGDTLTINGTTVSILSTGAGNDITINSVDQIVLTDFTNGGSGCSALETDASGNLTCGSDAGGNTAWDDIGDPDAGASIAFAEYAQTMDWDLATDVAKTAISFTFTNDVAGSNTQYLMYLDNLNDGGSNGVTESLLVLDNSDVNEAVTDGLLFVNAGGGFTDFIDTPSSVFKVDGSGNITGVGLTLTGDIGVNGDDITSDASLTLNATGYVRVGDTGIPGTAENDDDLYVQGRLEVDSFVNIDSDLSIEGSVDVGSTSTSFTFGADDIVFTSDTNITLSGGVNGLAFDTSTLSIDATNDRIGIGTISPGSKLDVVHASAPTVDMVNFTNTGQGTTTNGVDGLSIDFTAATDGAGDTNAGAHITITDSGDSGDTISGLQITAGTASAGTQYGISIDNITGGSGTEYALFIGTGWDRGLSVGSASTFTSTLTSEGTLVVGSSGNTFTFNPASGPVYAGTARPTKVVHLAPEYAGATLTASGSATITGSMVSDAVRDSTEGWENYYEWSSTQASLQDYTIAVKFRLPSDFAVWSTSNALQIDYVTERTDNTKNKLDVHIYNMTENPDKYVNRSVTNVSGTNAVWTTLTVDDSELDDNVAPDLDAAGEIMVIFLKPYSLLDAVNCTAGYDNGCYVRLGNIKLSYLAQF